MDMIIRAKYCKNCQQILWDWQQTTIAREIMNIGRDGIESVDDSDTQDSYNITCLHCGDSPIDILISLQSWQKVYDYCFNNKQFDGMPFILDCNNDVEVIEINDDKFNVIMLASLL